MNLLEGIYHLGLNRWQCAVFWRCTVDDFHQLDDGIYSAGYRFNSYRNHDASCTDLLHVGGVSRWQRIGNTNAATLTVNATKRR